MNINQHHFLWTFPPRLSHQKFSSNHQNHRHQLFIFCPQHHHLSQHRCYHGGLQLLWLFYSTWSHFAFPLISNFFGRIPPSPPFYIIDHDIIDGIIKITMHHRLRSDHDGLQLLWSFPLLLHLNIFCPTCRGRPSEGKIHLMSLSMSAWYFFKHIY